MKAIRLIAAILLTASPVVAAQDTAPTCDDLNWSAQVLAANPDIAESCQGVYERNGVLYAKSRIELVRVRGNTLTFRPIHTDGSLGDARRITVPVSWRAEIDGSEYRASELYRGQQLSIYLPEDRFALALDDDGVFDDNDEMIAIEEAAVVTMPKTASPRYAYLVAGLAFLGFGALLTRRRLVAAPAARRVPSHR